MAVRRAWYRSAAYSEPFEAKELGDGSLVECVQPNMADYLLLTRIYPSGFKQEITFRVKPSGEKQYLSIDDGPEHPNPKKAEERAKEFDEALANGEVNIRFRGAVPGQGISNTYDAATKKDYTQSDQFEREYNRMKLAKRMQSDHSTAHEPNEPKPRDTSGVNIQSFNVRAEGFRDVPSGT